MIAFFKRALPYHPEEGTVVALLLSMFLIRLAISAVFPITVDEAYAITVSRIPSLSFFDHPPFGFALAGLTAWLTGSEAPIVVRLPYVVSGTLTGWVLYCITRQLYGQTAGHIAIAWYSVAPFFFISAGHFVVPDGPLNLFLVLTFWKLLPIFIDDRSLDTQTWCLVGLTMALALLCKYHAVLFGISIFLVLALTPSLRRVFLTPGPWLALCLAVCGMVPMLVWNLQNEWVSFKFQAGRIGKEVTFQWVNFLTIQLGQLLYLLPGIWIRMLWLTGKSLQRPSFLAEKALAVVVVIPVLVFDIIALFNKGGLPHWTMSGFLFAFPFIGHFFSNQNAEKSAQQKKVFRVAVFGLPIVALIVSMQTHTAFLTRPFFASAPQNDIDWHLVSWTALADDFTSRGILDNDKHFIVPASWIEGGRAGYALGSGMPLDTPLFDPRHFYYMNDHRLTARKKGYVIFPARIGEIGPKTASLLGLVDRRFVRTGQNWTVLQTRAGFPAFEIGVIEVSPR